MTIRPVPRFVLASASPARKRLLQGAGIPIFVQPSDFDESQIQESDPDRLVRILAQGKAEAVAPLLSESLILGCDSVMGFEGEIHGKPSSAAEAIDRWKRMRGGVGQLYTGHCLIDQVQGKTLVRVGVTGVHFAQVSDAEVEAYVATGEPLNCAGCFALEGRGGFFVERLDGCHSNVIGLSLPLLRQMMADLQYPIVDFWLR